MDNKELLEYELAEALTLSFFGGQYYITFESVADVEEFLEFIHIYDHRFDGNFEKKEAMKEVFWKYSILLRHHQLEWNSKKDGFKKYDARELPYTKIKPYISRSCEIMHKAKELFDMCGFGKK